MKQAPGIEKIEYMILGSTIKHLIPDVKGKSTYESNTDEIKGSSVNKEQMSFRVVENNMNAPFISEFSNNMSQHLLIICSFKSGKILIIGSEDYKPAIKIKQTPGATAGDFVGYIYEVSLVRPLFN
jgi:hypothetical protein